MSALDDYLMQKRVALQWVKQETAAESYRPLPLRAHVTAEGRSGVRRIRVRDFQVITDSLPSFAGNDLGPSSPELALGALGSCLTHSWLIQAAAHNVPVDSLEVEVTGQLDSRGSLLGVEGVPVYPQVLAFTVTIASSASQDQIAELHRAVDRACPILNLLRRPQQIEGRVVHVAADACAPAAASPQPVSAEGVP
ncbi:MAG: OsmC family protein [Acetobacteraceae bacterium]|nr:OsmC family protein [Acetobacteraceae bacterium]